MQMADNRQKAKIHIAKAELRLDDATYRDVLHDRYRKGSSRDLSYSQAEARIRRIGLAELLGQMQMNLTI